MTTSEVRMVIVEDDSRLAFPVPRSADVDIDRLVEDLAGMNATDAAGTREPFSSPTSDVFRRSVNEAIAFGHNDVGCERFLLAPASAEGDEACALAAQGIECWPLRCGIGASLTGSAYPRAQTSATNAPERASRTRQTREDALVTGLGLPPATNGGPAENTPVGDEASLLERVRGPDARWYGGAPPIGRIAVRSATCPRVRVVQCDVSGILGVCRPPPRVRPLTRRRAWRSCVTLTGVPIPGC
ncbi:hypothetical protein J4H86_08070 [Spiractinospora alimapuensis]|uniref:hypothetical protein n=1 Tax=Spiractinospora alimapuensis TaxID=2820884 RepID=UPI001F3AA1E0|nr:hypothetical protein [Spiractinospora alimapuensis]QVQ53667.1 hypothetical protein J4H86_08070 [Spiractinospora alimapuensis]